MSLLIIDNYDSFTFNLYQMLQAETDLKVTVYRNDALTLTDVRSLKPKGIVISPGAGSPANPDDFGICRDVIAHSSEERCPLLGVCLGHQGIAHHFGAVIRRAPHILHGKTSNIQLTAPCPIFRKMPATFKAMRYHSLVVWEPTMPDCLEITARDSESHLVMALQHRTEPLFGVQFHPESIGTPEGKNILRNFVALC